MTSSKPKKSLADRVDKLRQQALQREDEQSGLDFGGTVEPSVAEPSTAASEEILKQVKLERSKLLPVRHVDRDFLFVRHVRLRPQG